MIYQWVDMVSFYSAGLSSKRIWPLFCIFLDLHGPDLTTRAGFNYYFRQRSGSLVLTSGVVCLLYSSTFHNSITPNDLPVPPLSPALIGRPGGETGHWLTWRPVCGARCREGSASVCPVNTLCVTLFKVFQCCYQLLIFNKAAWFIHFEERSLLTRHQVVRIGRVWLGWEQRPERSGCGRSCLIKAASWPPDGLLRCLGHRIRHRAWVRWLELTLLCRQWAARAFSPSSTDQKRHNPEYNWQSFW